MIACSQTTRSSFICILIRLNEAECRQKRPPTSEEMSGPILDIMIIGIAISITLFLFLLNCPI